MSILSQSENPKDVLNVQVRSYKKKVRKTFFSFCQLFTLTFHREKGKKVTEKGCKGFVTDKR